MLAGDLMRVLIAGKEPDGRSALANVLATGKDIEAFESAENISEILDKLQKDEYDVVLLKRPSHEMSEFELLDLLKKLDLLMPAVIGVSTRRQPCIAPIDNPTLKNLQRIFKQSESPFAPLIL